MAVAVGSCFQRPAMTWDAMPDSMTTSPDPEPQAPPSTSGTTIATTSATTGDVPAFGWSGYAERMNGRFAMVGFVAVLAIELGGGDTFWHWAGLVP